MSLRLQDEGQKKLTDCTDAHGVFYTDFFDLCFFWCKGIINGFASVTACGCCDSDCRVISYYFAYIYCPKESKCRHLQNPSKIPLSCQGTIRIKTRIKRWKYSFCYRHIAKAGHEGPTIWQTTSFFDIRRNRNNANKLQKGWTIRYYSGFRRQETPDGHLMTICKHDKRNHISELSFAPLLEKNNI